METHTVHKPEHKYCICIHILCTFMNDCCVSFECLEGLNLYLVPTLSNATRHRNGQPDCCQELYGDHNLEWAQSLSKQLWKQDSVISSPVCHQLRTNDFVRKKSLNDVICSLTHQGLQVVTDWMWYKSESSEVCDFGLSSLVTVWIISVPYVPKTALKSHKAFQRDKCWLSCVPGCSVSWRESGWVCLNLLKSFNSWGSVKKRHVRIESEFWETISQCSSVFFFTTQL